MFLEEEQKAAVDDASRVEPGGLLDDCEFELGARAPHALADQH